MKFEALNWSDDLQRTQANKTSYGLSYSSSKDDENVTSKQQPFLAEVYTSKKTHT